MTPQSSFMVVAPVDAKRENELRELLASMNDAPGRAKPDNALIPFGEFGLRLMNPCWNLLSMRRSGNSGSGDISSETRVVASPRKLLVESIVLWP